MLDAWHVDDGSIKNNKDIIKINDRILFIGKILSKLNEVEYLKFETTIKKARKIKKYTQEELGEKLHVSRKTISSWENGRSVPNDNLIKEIEKILDVKFKKNNVENITSDKNIKSISTLFDNYILLFNIISSLLSIIDTATPIFSFWILPIQIIVDITLFYNLNERFKKVFEKEKIFIITILISCVITLTLVEIEQIIRDKVFSLNFIFVIAMIIRSLIISYGILFLLFLKKLWNV